MENVKIGKNRYVMLLFILYLLSLYIIFYVYYLYILVKFITDISFSVETYFILQHF